MNYALCYEHLWAVLCSFQAWVLPSALVRKAPTGRWHCISCHKQRRGDVQFFKVSPEKLYYITLFGKKNQWLHLLSRCIYVRRRDFLYNIVQHYNGRAASSCWKGTWWWEVLPCKYRWRWPDTVNRSFASSGHWETYTVGFPRLDFLRGCKVQWSRIHGSFKHITRVVHVLSCTL